jgi:hypothetical protein
MVRSILVLLSFHSYGSLEHDPEGEMKNLPRSLLKYLRRFHPRWPVAAFLLEGLRMSVEGPTADATADELRAEIMRCISELQEAGLSTCRRLAI